MGGPRVSFMDGMTGRVVALTEDHPWATAWGLVGVFTVLRVVLLGFYQSSLGPDEAQYWFWSREFDWGYYSKPPMIAWLIATATAVFGNTEWAVRLFSPLLIGGAGLFLFGTARRLAGDGPAWWTLLLWLLMPAVMLGSTIMTTDIPLLFCWCAALFCLTGLAETSSKRAALGWSFALGVAIGAGFLSKYAMVYFPLGWALAAIFSPYARRTWQGGYALIVPVVALIIFAPNLFWNAGHGFQTLGHTADNANWQENLFNPSEMFQFIGDQFGVAGPFVFGGLLAGLWRWSARTTTGGRAAMLVAFALPPLVLISGQALLSRAHANWAMAAYPAALILIPMWMYAMKSRWVLWASAGLHAALGLMATAIFLNFEIADALGRSNDVKRVRSWDISAAQITEAAPDGVTVVVDEREIAAHLMWEWRAAPRPIMVADLNQRPDNTYEYAFPFRPAADATYILASQFSDVACAYHQFATIVPLGESFVDLKASRRGLAERTIPLYRLSGFDPARPKVPCD